MLPSKDQCIFQRVGIVKRFKLIGKCSSFLFSFGAALWSLLLSAQPGLTGTPVFCPMEGGRRGIVTSVNERLEVTLEDGTLLAIAGIEPPRVFAGQSGSARKAGVEPDAAERLRGWLFGREIHFTQAGEQHDRWGRWPAFLFAQAGETMVPVGEALLDAGLARYIPGESVHPCHARMLGAEEAARRSGLGIWRDPYYAIISEGERRTFADKSGTFVLVEGEVTRIASSATRTRLYLGRNRSQIVTITILRRDIKMFEATGMTMSRLLGQTLRVRGLLDTTYGPEIILARPDALEILGGDSVNLPDSRH